MSKVIPQGELRNHNAVVIAAVAAGETFVVTRNGTPVAELRPIRAPRRRFVTREELVAAVAGSPRVDWRRFRADLDRVTDPTLR
jgi:prevent-host-death family protein